MTPFTKLAFSGFSQVHQNVGCPDCDMYSHDTHHSQFFYHTSATALRNEAAVDRDQPGAGGRVASLGQLLARIEGQTFKTCDTDNGDPFQPSSLNLPACKG